MACKKYAKKNKKQLMDIMTPTDFTQPDTLGMVRDQKEAAKQKNLQEKPDKYRTDKGSGS